MASTYIQFRTDEKDKKEASEILNSLGTNLSAVLNMTIKQIIIQKGIPFNVKLPQEDSAVRNVTASMAMEGMNLTEDQVKRMNVFADKTPEEQEKEINELVSQYEEKETKSV